MAAELSSLPDDMLRDILLRLRADAPALFRCATVCRRWRRLVGDPAFLRRCWPPDQPEKKNDDGGARSFAGFFAMVRQAGEPCFVPAPGSPLGGGRRRALGSFVPGAAPGLLSNAVPVAWRHGLLLVRLASYGGFVRLAVCDLLTGACHVVRPLNPARESEVQTGYGYAILTAADCRSPSALFFKVAVVALGSGDRHNAHKVHLHTFSSSASGGEAGWSTPPAQRFDCEHGCIGNYGPICHGDAVVCRGTAHWLFSDQYWSCFHTIQVDAETGRLSSAKPPSFPQSDIADHSCLGVAADGALSLLRMRRRQGFRPRVDIWTRQDDDHATAANDDQAAPRRWLCTKTLEPGLPEGEKKEAPYCSGGAIMDFMLGEKCGKLLVTDNRSRVYVADLGTGMMEQVTAWPGSRLFINRDEVVPLEIDWTAMFVSRLWRSSTLTSKGGFGLVACFH